MTWTTTEKINQAKKLVQQTADEAHVAPGAHWWYNSQRGLEVYARAYWSDIDSIPGASNPTEADAAVAANPTILEKVKVRLTLDITSNNRQYEARAVYGDMSSDPIFDWVQPNLIIRNGSASFGYLVRLYHGDPDGTGTEINTTYNSGPGGEPCWEWFFATGLLGVSTTESSGFRTFYDTDGLWIVGYRYIGPTGGGAGSVGASDVDPLIRTQESINMEVDHATGIEPPAGSIIRTQAEYDALVGSSPLKYCENVREILPEFIDHFIHADVFAGLQYAKPKDIVAGFPNAYAFLYFNNWLSSKDQTHFEFVSGEFRERAKIRFRGAEVVLEAEQTGTINTSTYSLQATSASWTPDEWVGKWIKVTADASAGQYTVIDSNTSDTLYFTGSLSTSGACSFEIVEPDTTLVMSSDGSSADVFQFIRRPLPTTMPTGVELIFESVKVGTASYPCKPVLVSGAKIKFNRCAFRMHDTNYLFMLDNNISISSALHMIDCHVDAPTSSCDLMFDFRNEMAYVILDGILMTGECVSSVMVMESVGPSLAWLDTIFRVDVPTVFLVYGGGIDFEGRNIIDGMGTATGLYAVGTQLGGKIKFETMSTLSINDCAVALDFNAVGHVHSYYSPVGSGNAVGWRIREGSQVVIRGGLSSLGATDEIEIDGQVIDYADMPAGSRLHGEDGSMLVRVV